MSPAEVMDNGKPRMNHSRMMTNSALEGHVLQTCVLLMRRAREVCRPMDRRDMSAKRQRVRSRKWMANLDRAKTNPFLESLDDDAKG